MALIRWTITGWCALCLNSSGEIVPQLKVSHSKKALVFELGSMVKEELWLLQVSGDGISWQDVIFLEFVPAPSSFRAEFDKGVLESRGTGTQLFRAAQLSEEDASYRFFLAARILWRESAPDRYTYTVRSDSGMIGYEARYTVENGVVTAMESLWAFPPFVTPPAEQTIDDWFDVVERAFAQNAESVEIVWDEVRGYPKSGFIDISRMIADEERGWTITEFAALE